jgi:predicted amidohydrolase YtcJ
VWADAIAITGQRVSAVGSDADIKKLAGANTRVIDAMRHVIVPGFNDAHVHVDTGPEGTHLAREWDPQNDPTAADLLKEVADAATKTPKGTWIFGSFGGTVLDDPEITRFALDKVSADHPVLLRSWTGHGTFFNTRAMHELGLSETQPDPPGGFFGRLKKGGSALTLSGFAHEYAEHRIWRKVDELATDDQIAAGFKQVAEDATRWGLTSIQVMTTGHPADRLARILGGLHLPVRVRLVRYPLEDMASWQGPTGAAPPNAPAAMVRISGTKWILDGTPIERLAFMRQPYLDRKGWRGQMNWPVDSLTAMLKQSVVTKEPIMLHAVGDATIDAALTAMRTAAPSMAWPPLRPRIEHGDFASADQMDRMKALGVVVVENPSHFMLADVMKARYGGAHTQRLKSLVAAGIPVALGSDGPMNPYLNMMFAGMHADNPAEAIAAEDAVRLYTRGSAYAEFAENDKGTLQPGMLADLALLSQDIFQSPPDALPKTESLLTMIGGRIVRENIH